MDKIDGYLSGIYVFNRNTTPEIITLLPLKKVAKLFNNNVKFINKYTLQYLDIIIRNINNLNEDASYKLTNFEAFYEKNGEILNPLGLAYPEEISIINSQVFKNNRNSLVEIIKQMVMFNKPVSKESVMMMLDAKNRARLTHPFYFRNTLFEIMKGENSHKFFDFLREFNILDLLFPELMDCFYTRQDFKGDSLDNVGSHTLESLKNAPHHNLILKLAVLLHDIAKPYVFDGNNFYNHDIEGAYLSKQFCQRYYIQKNLSTKVELLVKYHMFDCSPGLEDSQLLDLINCVGPENIHLLLDLRIADRAGNEMNQPTSKIDFYRERVKTLLSHPSHYKDKMLIRDETIMNILGISDPELIKLAKDYMDKKNVPNTNRALRQALKNLLKIKCPYGLPFLLETNKTQKFDDVKCKIFCKWKCV